MIHKPYEKNGVVVNVNLDRDYKLYLSNKGWKVSKKELVKYETGMW